MLLEIELLLALSVLLETALALRRAWLTIVSSYYEVVSDYYPDSIEGFLEMFSTKFGLSYVITQLSIRTFEYFFQRRK